MVCEGGAASADTSFETRDATGMSSAPSTVTSLSLVAVLLLSHSAAALNDALLLIDAELGDSPVALLDAHFLTALARNNGCLSRRQELPPEAFVSLERLRKFPAHSVARLRHDTAHLHLHFVREPFREISRDG